MPDSLIKQLRMEAARKALMEEEAENAEFRRNADVGLRGQVASDVDKGVESLELAADPFEAMRTYKHIAPYKEARWRSAGGMSPKNPKPMTEDEYRKMVEDAPFPDETARRFYEDAIKKAPSVQNKAEWKGLISDSVLGGKK